MIRPNRPVADKPPVSVAVRVTEVVPDADGVPVIAPVVRFRLNPAGKPVAEYVSDWPTLGSVKAVVGMVKVDTEPTVNVIGPSAAELLNTGARFGTTDKPSKPVVDNPPASAAVMVSELVLVVAAVPVMPPVAGFSVRPVGKPTTAYINSWPVLGSIKEPVGSV